MRASLLLASQRSTQYVTKQDTLTLVSTVRTFRIHSWRESFQSSALLGRSIATRRSISSILASRNHLQDVKEYTAANPVTIWQSASNNPYENLAIENYLLKNSDVGSKILFTYVNWPCVVIGRNQNPWLECNLSRMQEGLPHHVLIENEGTVQDSKDKSTTGDLIPLALVRRRSGGGTVIHDAGNLNFSFIVPNDKDFTRDKHGELVAEMLQRLHSRSDMKPYYSSVRVNERHDIVMKQQNTSNKEFKVSGSAFKLTRGRALHHGTILHSSPNIREQTGIGDDKRGVFSEILSSPAKPYLEAKGVGSVRSPVHNLFEANSPSDRLMYNRKIHLELQHTFKKANNIDKVEIQHVGALDCTEESNKQIFDDIQELLTKEWQFCQTPSFEYTSAHDNGVHIHFQVKHGIIGTPTVKHTNGDPAQDYNPPVNLQGRKLHEIEDWSEVVPSSTPSSVSITSHLAKVFPNVNQASRVRRKPVNSDTSKMLESEELQRDGVVIERRSTDGAVETEKEGESLVVER